MVEFRPSETFYTDQGLPSTTEIERSAETTFMYEFISLLVGEPLEVWEASVSAPSRLFNGKVFIRGLEYDDEYIEDFTIDETVNPDESFVLGSVASSKLDLTVLNITDVNFENAIIEPHVGLEVDGVIEYVPLGVFTVDSIDMNKGRTELVCFDNMIKLERPYFSNLTYPATLRAVAQEICSKAGVTLATTVPTTRVSKIDGFTLREAIGFVASFLGGFARFNRTGQLEVIPYRTTDKEITADNYIDLQTSERVFSIGKLTCKIADEEDGEKRISTGSGSNEVYFENPIMTQAQLNSIYGALSTLNYMPYTMNWQGDPRLQAGDKIQVTDLNGQVYPTLLMEQQIKYNGGLSATASAKGKTETAQEFQSSGSLTQKVERYSIEQALIKEAFIENLVVVNGKFDNLSAEYATIENLKAVYGKIDNLTADFATIDNLDATNARITNLRVTTAMIDDLVVTTAKIADASITSAKIVDASIVNAKIEDAAITSAKIGDAQITTAKIEVGAITTALIEIGAIGTAQIADASITDAHILNLTANKIQAGTIDTGQVTVSGANGNLIIKNNRLQIFDNQTTPVERVSIGDVDDDGLIYGLRVRGPDGTTVLYDENGVYNEGITDGAITNPKIGSGAVENRHITADTITGNKLVVDAITGREIKAQAITANHMTANSITAANGAIANLAVTSAKISDAAITNAKIANATITSAKIASIDAGKIKTGVLEAIDITGVNITGASIIGSTIKSEDIGENGWRSVTLEQSKLSSEYVHTYAGYTDKETVTIERGQIWLDSKSNPVGAEIKTIYSSYLGPAFMGFTQGALETIVSAGYIITPEMRVSKGVILGDTATSGTLETGELVVTADSQSALLKSLDTYRRTYSGSANMLVTVSGVLGRVTSASKYKLCIEDVETVGYAEKILMLNPSSWFDKAGTEAYANYLTENDGCAKGLNDSGEEIPHLDRHYGLIAEDVERVGLENYVSYGGPDDDGKREVEGIEYDRLWTLLIPVVRDLKRNTEEDINWLKMENQLLKSRITKLEGVA